MSRFRIERRRPGGPPVKRFRSLHDAEHFLRLHTVDPGARTALRRLLQSEGLGVSTRMSDAEIVGRAAVLLLHDRWRVVSVTRLQPGTLELGPEEFATARPMTVDDDEAVMGDAEIEEPEILDFDAVIEEPMIFDVGATEPEEDDGSGGVRQEAAEDGSQTGDGADGDAGVNEPMVLVEGDAEIEEPEVGDFETTVDASDALPPLPDETEPQAAAAA